MEEHRFSVCRFLRWDGFNVENFIEELKGEIKQNSLKVSPNESDPTMMDLEVSIPPELRHTVENILKKYTKIYTWINEQL